MSLLGLDGRALSSEKDRSHLAIGLAVILRLRGRDKSALICNIHPDSATTTNRDGDDIPWLGSRPFIDAIFVDGSNVVNQPSGVSIPEFLLSKIERVPYCNDVMDEQNALCYLVLPILNGE